MNPASVRLSVLHGITAREIQPGKSVKKIITQLSHIATWKTRKLDHSFALFLWNS
jgi:hypothetical protein